MSDKEEVWIDSNKPPPNPEPHRNILVKFTDANGKVFTTKVSSLIIHLFNYSHWREEK